MIQFTDYCDFINGIIKDNEFSEIISIYSYGSIAQGNFEKNYSDADLWFIIKCNSIQERLNSIRKISIVFDQKIREYLDKIHDNKENKKCHYRDILFYTENEFKKYCLSYPTRVIYPIKTGIWKLAYGKDLFQDIEVPDRKNCIKHLLYDYEVFASEFNRLAFSDNTRDMVKYFLRTMKKAIWILNDKYLYSKDDVIEKAPEILSEDKLFVNVIKRIKQLKISDYEINGYEYLDLFLDCSRIIENYGGKINKYIVMNGYSTLDIRDYNETTVWGCLAWDIACLLDRWCNRTDKISNKDILNILYEDDYINRMKYFNYIITNKLKAEEVRLSVWDGMGKRSKILSPAKIDKNLYSEVLTLDGYKFLLCDHRDNMISKRFETMEIESLIRYVEDKYIPAVYEVFEYLMMLR